jgi:histidinol-phosphate aminotransferase
MNAPLPKAWVMAIAPYVPGRSTTDGDAPVIKLSSNENPLGTSAQAVSAFSRHAGDLARYPDAGAIALREAIAAHHDLDPARVIYGTGSDTDHATDVDAILACVTDRTRIVFVANPNNPTGTFARKDEIARLHAALPPHVMLVLDQAYAEYLAPEDDDGGLELARTQPNVIVTRTFSKIHGLAAERIGWGYGSEEAIAAMHRIRAPFCCTTAGQEAAIAALGAADFIAQSREHNRVWRAWFAKEMAKLGNAGLRPVPSEANFVLVLFEGAVTAETAYKALLERGYIVRWLPGQGLANGLRMTIGTEAETRGLAEALREIVAG